MTAFPFSTMSCLPCRPNRDAAALTVNALLNVLESSGATFATPDECAQLVRHATALMPSATSKLQHDLTLEDTGAAVTARVDGAPSAHLLLVRLVERMRRLVAAEFDVPLITLKPRLAFVNRIVAPDSLSEFDVGELHADECSNAAYHYSSIIYLNQGDEGKQYTGGDLCFVDPGGNRLLRPEVGLGALFSSGWENVHHVTPVLSGTRFCMPLFFTSQPPPLRAPPTHTTQAAKSRRSVDARGVGTLRAAAKGLEGA